MRASGFMLCWTVIAALVSMASPLSAEILKAHELREETRGAITEAGLRIPAPMVKGSMMDGVRRTQFDNSQGPHADGVPEIESKKCVDILSISPLVGGPMKTLDPFLFCVYHKDLQT